MRIPGIAHRSDLPGLGITDATRRRLLRQGQMRRVGTWYVTDEAPEALVALLEQGVRPTCVTAAEQHDLWVPLHTGDHVYRPRGLVPGAPGSGLVKHGSEMRIWPDRDPDADLPLALAHAARCLSVRDTAILVESALNRRSITMHEVQRLLAFLPAARRAQLGRVSPLAESGTETAVRWWLESLHIPVTPQVQIPGVGRVDLKLGASWIIECDSVSFHHDPQQYHRDRARDLRLQARRYMVTRLTWEQVFLDWEETASQLLAIIRRRDHRRPLAG
ncbi:endonuclease domain-containing protein [Brachybacterium sp. AOP42-C2-15]|uniref:endonuclease domain-containing protein n=1 Tax=unclassified Brachybacterium TaxID=2623841 RepID=UPI003F9964C1